MSHQKSKYSLLEAKTKLEAYCAYQERCEQDISKKLIDWHISPEDRDILIADLISNNFLSEERFAEAYVSGKFNIKKWGKIKIKNHLKSKRISDYSIRKAMAQIEPDAYEETLQYLAEKKWLQLRGSQWEKLAKLRRYLHNKGYESDILGDLLQTFIQKK